MKHPLDTGQRISERGEVGAAERVDQGGAGSGPAELHEVRPVPVPVARRTLGVDCDRAPGRREGVDGTGERFCVDDDRRQTLARR
jgi:hypothetical protein